MSDFTQISEISRIVRAILKDRLRIDGRDSYIYAGDNNFTLSEDFPLSSTVAVFKNGVLLGSGYSYNASTKIVTITASLSTNDIILITYSFYDKYSDTDMVDYIESSFPQFSQFGYRKIFKLNDARDKVLTIDGVNPTVSECYQIAIITSICIDPENIEIKTKDFSLTAANGKHSKFELIRDSFMQFTAWAGEITFDERLRPDVN